MHRFFNFGIIIICVFLFLRVFCVFLKEKSNKTPVPKVSHVEAIHQLATSPAPS